MTLVSVFPQKNGTARHYRTHSNSEFALNLGRRDIYLPAGGRTTVLVKLLVTSVPRSDYRESRASDAVQRVQSMNTLKTVVSSFAAQPARSARNAITVLLVDDTEMVREILRTVLTHEGYVVVTAPDGLSALEIASRTRFD